VGTFAHLPPAVEEHVCRKLGLKPAPASSQVVQRDRHAEFFTSLALLGASIEKFAVEIRHLQRTEVREVEEHVCRKLGLHPAPASSQIVQRDRHAEYFGALALLGASIEKFAVEIRHLQRTEVREAEEPFTPGQKGSSAMPHKRNPILSENLSGLARLLRGYAVSALEDVALWHERDISHSSVERVIGPDATIVMDFMLHRFAGLMENLRVYPEQMAKNLELLGGVVNSQRILLELARKGMDRQAAYVIVQRNAMRMFEQGVPFRQALLQDKDLLAVMTPAEIEDCFSAGYHLKHVDDIFQRVFGRGA
jgi:adenylosuccinate lyase